MMWEICIHNDNEVSWRVLNAVYVSRSWNDMKVTQAISIAILEVLGNMSQFT